MVEKTIEEIEAEIKDLDEETPLEETSKKDIPESDSQEEEELGIGDYNEDCKIYESLSTDKKKSYGLDYPNEEGYVSVTDEY